MNTEPKPEEEDAAEETWVVTPFEPFKIRGPTDRPTPKAPNFPAKAWQCIECKTWQLEGDRCSKCGRPAT